MDEESEGEGRERRPSVYRESKGAAATDGVNLAALRVLGEGASDVVYSLNSTQILKCSRRDLLTDPNALLDLGISRALAHPNARRLMSCASVVDSRGNVMARKCYRAMTPLPELGAELDYTQRKCVLYQLARALCALHSAGIVHADVKSANVMTRPAVFGKSAVQGRTREYLEAEQPAVVADFVIELSDYGNCLLLPRRAAGLCTETFRPPECALGGGTTTTPAMDVWGAGMVAVDMLGLRAALSARREGDCVRVLAEMHGVTSEGIDERAREANLVRYLRAQASTQDEVDFVLACLEPDPAKRISASDAMRHRYFEDVAPGVERQLEGEWEGRPTGVAFDPALCEPGDLQVPQDWWETAMVPVRTYEGPCGPRVARMAADLLYRAKSGSCPASAEFAQHPVVAAYGALHLATKLLEFWRPPPFERDPGAPGMARKGARALLVALDGAVVNPKALPQIRAGQPVPDQASTMAWTYYAS